jgi:Protein of unknown function (DUF3730)
MYFFQSLAYVIMKSLCSPLTTQILAAVLAWMLQHQISTDSKVSLSYIQWSLEACMYPIIAISATGNIQASDTLKQLTQCIAFVNMHINKHSTTVNSSITSLQTQPLSLSTMGSAIHVLCTVRNDHIAITATCHEATKQFTAVSTNKDMDSSADNSANSDAVTTTLQQCEATYMLLTPVLLLHNDKRTISDEQQQCAELMLLCTTAVVKAYPLMAVHILPQLLHCLSKWQHTPLLRVKLLYTLPMLGGHKVTAKQVWSVIHALLLTTTTTATDNANSSSSHILSEQQQSAAVTQSTRTIGLRMAYKLYEVNSRMLSKLATAIELCYSSDTTSNDDMRLSIAATLYDVCKHDAEEGVEYITNIQQSLQDELPSIVTLALQVCLYDDVL